MNIGLVNSASLQRRPAEEILAVNLSSSFGADKRGDYFMDSPRVARSMAKLRAILKRRSQSFIKTLFLAIV